MPAAEENSAAARSMWDGQAVGIRWYWCQARPPARSLWLFRRSGFRDGNLVFRWLAPWRRVPCRGTTITGRRISPRGWTGSRPGSLPD